MPKCLEFLKGLISKSALIPSPIVDRPIVLRKALEVSYKITFIYYRLLHELGLNRAGRVEVGPRIGGYTRLRGRLSSCHHASREVQQSLPGN